MSEESSVAGCLLDLQKALGDKVTTDAGVLLEHGKDSAHAVLHTLHGAEKIVHFLHAVLQSSACHVRGYLSPMCVSCWKN